MRTRILSERLCLDLIEVMTASFKNMITHLQSFNELRNMNSSTTAAFLKLQEKTAARFGFVRIFEICLGKFELRTLHSHRIGAAVSIRKWLLKRHEVRYFVSLKLHSRYRVFASSLRSLSFLSI